jgi:hypothetical protein
MSDPEDGGNYLPVGMVQHPKILQFTTPGGQTLILECFTLFFTKLSYGGNTFSELHTNVV